jgi:hypothetical protein
MQPLLRQLQPRRCWLVPLATLGWNAIGLRSKMAAIARSRCVNDSCDVQQQGPSILRYNDERTGDTTKPPTGQFLQPSQLHSSSHMRCAARHSQ